MWVNIPQDIRNLAHFPVEHSDFVRASHRHPTAVKIGAACGREEVKLFLLYILMWACKRAEYYVFQYSIAASSSNLYYVGFNNLREFLLHNPIKFLKITLY